MASNATLTLSSAAPWVLYHEYLSSSIVLQRLLPGVLWMWHIPQGLLRALYDELCTYFEFCTLRAISQMLHVKCYTSSTVPLVSYSELHTSSSVPQVSYFEKYFKEYCGHTTSIVLWKLYFECYTIKCFTSSFELRVLSFEVNFQKVRCVSQLQTPPTIFNWPGTKVLKFRWLCSEHLAFTWHIETWGCWIVCYALFSKLCSAEP